MKKPAGTSPFSALIVKWRAEQLELAARRIVSPLDPLPRFVAGADAAFGDGGKAVLAVVVVYDRVEKKTLEVRSVRRRVSVPYIPSFLSFREGPALTDAINKVRHKFGVICFDGQGVAHPRRCGLAAHLGISLDVPSVGFAKSRLIGTHDEPAQSAGSFVTLQDGKDVIGAVLRTRDNLQPIYVSEGHRVDLPSSVRLAMACVDRHRVPEPTRLADILVAKLKRGEPIS